MIWWWSLYDSVLMTFDPFMFVMSLSGHFQALLTLDVHPCSSCSSFMLFSMFCCCSGISCVVRVLRHFRSRRMIPDQCQSLRALRRLWLTLYLWTDTIQTHRLNSKLHCVLLVSVSVIYQQMNESGLCDYTGILGDSDDSDDGTTHTLTNMPLYYHS